MRLKEQGAAAILSHKGHISKVRSKRKTGPNANSHCQLEQLNVWNNAFFKSTNLRRMEDEWESVDQME